MKEIRKIACLGGGLIGAGWATNFVLRGYETVVYDINDDCLLNAQKRIEGSLRFLMDKGVIDREQFKSALELASYTTDVQEALTGADFIQESAPEKYEVKQELLQYVDKYAQETAIFASSTSGLLISEIAKYSKFPERCLGSHPYNPPYLIPLVEITKGPQTAPEVVEAACEFYRKLGKEPIVLQKEALGFIANRLQVALYREAVDLVMRGVCSVEDVDKAALYGPGLRFGILGPNMIFHLGGGPYGIKGILHHIGPSVELWWQDMADWKKWPSGWGDIAEAGVKQELANRPEEFGRTSEEVANFRDDMLIQLLKLHKKL